VVDNRLKAVLGRTHVTERQMQMFFFTARSPSSFGQSPRNFATWSEVSSIL